MLFAQARPAAAPSSRNPAVAVQMYVILLECLTLHADFSV